MQEFFVLPTMENPRLNIAVNDWWASLMEVFPVYCVRNPLLYSYFCGLVIYACGVSVTSFEAVALYEYAWLTVR